MYASTCTYDIHADAVLKSITHMGLEHSAAHTLDPNSVQVEVTLFREGGAGRRTRREGDKARYLVLRKTLMHCIK